MASSEGQVVRLSHKDWAGVMVALFFLFASGAGVFASTHRTITQLQVNQAVISAHLENIASMQERMLDRIERLENAE